MDQQHHWESIYDTKSPEETSWYEPHLGNSLDWIAELAPSRSASIIDIGGGMSTLVDDLLIKGFRSLTVLDIAGSAIERAQKRLGKAAENVDWIIGDLTSVALPQQAYDVWHDRAAFHFLTERDQRLSYVRQLTGALKPSGKVIIATFSMNGPQSCSGLRTARYDAQSLQRELGSEFRLMKSAFVVHRTPMGTMQEFLYCQMERA